MERIARSPRLRAELGHKGYDGFVKGWCREAHLMLYFDYLHRSAQKKFGRIRGWSKEVLFCAVIADPEKSQNVTRSA